jgi:carbon storage regulator
MLVLSREIGEQVVLGDDIRVKVVAINGNRVRLGLEAPAGVIIRREELVPPDGEPDSPSKRGGRLDLP